MVTLSFPADTRHLARLGAFVQDACAGHPQPVLIELAVTEAVVNAIRHGRARRCRVGVEELDGRYRVVVEDDGEPFDPLAAEAKPLGELREHGYGLAILQSVGDDLEYRRDGEWNRLTLTFSIHADSMNADSMNAANAANPTVARAAPDNDPNEGEPAGEVGSHKQGGPQ